MAEDVEDLFYYGNIADVGQANLSINRYPLSAITQLSKNKTLDIIDTDSATRMQYHWIPACGYSTIYKRQPESISGGNRQVTDGSLKTFVFIADGCAVGTKFVFDFELTFQCEVITSSLNLYPSQYSTCFLNPDPEIAYLNTKQDLALNVETDESKFVKDAILASVAKRNVSEEKFFLGTDHSGRQFWTG
jgi:hypothetical protein